MFPVTIPGKIIGFIYVFSSLGVLGLLISTISNKYYSAMQDRKLGYNGTKFQHHILIIGWNDFSKQVADEIYHSSKKIAIVTDKKDNIDLIYKNYEKENVFVLFAEYGNYEMLKLVNAAEATTVFVSLDDDSATLLYVVDFKKRFPNVAIVVSIEKSRLKDTFLAAGVTYVISRNEIASKMVASFMFEPEVADMSIDIISSARGTEDYDIQQYLVNNKNPFIGSDCLSAFLELKTKYNTVLMAISKMVDGERVLFKNPADDQKISLDDYLIVLCDGATKPKLEGLFVVEEGRL